MYTNYWYFIALGATFSIISNALDDFTLASLFFLWLLYLCMSNRLSRKIFITTCISFISFYFYLPSINHSPQIASPPNEMNKHISGKIVSPVNIKEKSIQFTFEELHSHHKILVVHFYEEPLEDEQIESIKYGAACSIIGEVSLPERARNPHQFDYQRYLLKKGIKYQLIVDEVSDMICHEQKILQHIFSLRNTLLRLSTEKLQKETAAWMQALVLGNDAFIDEETIKLFRRWSLSHILAISGLHIGIIVAIIYAILVRFSITTKETAQTILMMFLPIYALLAGAQPSVWRASLTVVLSILLFKTKLKMNFTDMISIVFLSLIIIDPYIVYHIGFQFSFLVSFGLILSQNWMRQTTSNVLRIFQISFVSQMVILPLQIHYFFTFQPLSILLNVLVVPYFSIFVIPTMFILLFVIYLPLPIIQIVEKIFTITHEIMLTLINLVDDYFYFPMNIGTFPIYFAVVYYVLFIIFMSYLERQQTEKAFLYGIATCMLLFVLIIRPYLSPIGKVTMLDIGQGDAYIIELPYRKGVFIIDAGAQFSFTDFTPTDTVYEQIIRPYLLGEGIHKIDAIFLSHADLDHNGSVHYIIDEFPVNEMIISDYYPIQKEELKTWQQSNISVTRTSFNEKIERKGQRFYTLSPQRDKGSENENSLVLYTKIGDKTWLFTGDIDKQTEKEMIRNYPNLQVDILKVGHHGSNTSTDPQFLQRIEPTYALISVGVNNRFGHPTSEVIQTLVDENITIFRTDKHGAVQYRYHAKNGYFKVFIHEQK